MHAALEHEIKKKTKDKSIQELAEEGWIPLSGGIYDFQSFTTSDGKLHCDKSTAFGWADYAAHRSKGFFDRIIGMVLKDFYLKASQDREDASKEMYQLACKLSAGYLNHFYENILMPEVEAENNWVSLSLEPRHWNSTDRTWKKKNGKGLFLKDFEGPYDEKRYQEKKESNRSYDLSLEDWVTYQNRDGKGLDPKNHAHIRVSCYSEMRNYEYVARLKPKASHLDWSYGIVFHSCQDKQYRLGYRIFPSKRARVEFECMHTGFLQSKQVRLDQNAHEFRIVLLGKTVRCYFDGKEMFFVHDLDMRSGYYGVFVNGKGSLEIQSASVRHFRNPEIRIGAFENGKEIVRIIPP
jgi:hypothetical protein